MANDPIRLAVIIGSIREGRFGDKPARWFINQARQRNDVDLDVIDLKDTPLPAVLSYNHPQEVSDLAARIEAADGFVVVTPEYNHGYPASLKLAIDWTGSGYKAKPIGFVSYGGMAGGLRSVEKLRLVFAELHAVTIRDTVSFHMAFDRFDERGELQNPEQANAAAHVMLKELLWWADALREARAKRPYGE